MGKTAIIILEFVDDSVANSNNAIAEDLFKRFMDEVVPAPWVKEIKAVVVQDC